MRARYSAFVMGETRFLLETTHPDYVRTKPDPARWRAEVEATVRDVRFTHLAVLQEHSEGDRGEVRFVATMRRGALEKEIGEDSSFVREGGRWYYHAGETFVPQR